MTGALIPHEPACLEPMVWPSTKLHGYGMRELLRHEMLIEHNGITDTLESICKTHGVCPDCVMRDLLNKTFWRCLPDCTPKRGCQNHPDAFRREWNRQFAAALKAGEPFESVRARMYTKPKRNTRKRIAQ